MFPIKESGDRPPLFHLGGASVLRNLALHLPEDQPLYALLEQDLDADHFFTSVEEIVPHCIEGLRAVQPRGPYLIAGLCFGGVVALEMSRRLRAEGEEVALTLMIDSFAPGAATPKADVGAANTLGARVRKNLRPARMARKIRGYLWRAAWGPMHRIYGAIGRPMPAWLRDVEEANTIASDSYRADPFDGDVTLFIASEKDPLLDYAPLNGWEPLIEGDLRIAHVVGGHLSVYDEPHVAHLAAELAAELDRCIG